MSSSSTMSSAPVGRTRSPWAVWWLSALTLGVYYLVWYVRLNKEIARAAWDDDGVGTLGLWLSQCVPFVSWVGLAHTAQRLAEALECAGGAPAVSVRRTILASLWFGSHTRYLQRQANELWLALENQPVVERVDPLDLIYAYSRAPRALLPGSQPQPGPQAV